MRTLWFVVYNTFGVLSLKLIFGIYSLFNSKVKEGLKGRRDLFEKLDKSLSAFVSGKKIMIHCSSLGEYQQAIPLVNEFLKYGYNIVLSFFSPSGFNNSKIQDERVIKTYLPFDSLSNEKKLIKKIMPDVIVFMRYDLWFNLLYTAKQEKVLTVLANARFDEKDLTWKIPVISSFKKTLYGMIDTVFVIDEYDESNYKKKLKTHNVNILKSGDSKFERVHQSAKFENHVSVLPENITKSKKVFVIGSSWKEDEEVLLPAVDKTLKYDKSLLTVLVPHEPKETKISAIEKVLQSRYENLSSIRYSKLENYKGENVIIVDKMGLLSKLYSGAYMSYVGGGFKTGLHNILEPAIYNMPILFSNKVKNSDEDEILIQHGCGFVIENTKQFYKIFREFINNTALRNETGDKCRIVFKDSQGIAEKLVKYILNNKNQNS
ncbi:MAG: hypothetical protein HGGPFJEG_00839 [Ignavibacteria bacterium]|nr:hypothetical protein [Ignavibacteria bacterium]